MATRADQAIDKATILNRLSGGAIAEGVLIKFGADDNTVVAGADDDLGIGISLQAVTAAGQPIDFITFGPVARVKVGTGGATRGQKAKYVVTGFTNAPAHDSSGATDVALYGVFIQSGVAGDYVGMIVMPQNRGSV